LQPSSVVVVYDRKLAARAASLSARIAKTGLRTTTIGVRASEPLKTFAGLAPVYDKLVRANADRHSVVVAIGGGTVGDAIGFVAATYLRGVRWVGVPTTLLAQVDSAIGGKTGINLTTGKNLVGAFHQPAFVACDTAVLATLHDRDIVSGLGEIVKYGLALDADFHARLVRDEAKLLARNPAAMRDAIVRSIELKADIVARDEYEGSGVRELLNFGHTFAHALETATDYKRFRHGEAVLLGMRGAVHLSRALGRIDDATARAADARLRRFTVPRVPAAVTTRDLERALARDKKRGVDGKVRFVVLDRIGAASSHRADPKLVRDAFAALRA
jgi:3-dehydroquinate synthase